MGRDTGKEPESVGDVRVVKETDAAILVELDDGTRHWIPKSCVHEDSTVESMGDEGELVVHRWFAEREGLA